MSSHPEVFLGSAVWIQVEGGHAGFTLSDPDENSGLALFVRFTTYVPSRHAHLTIFTPENYHELKHESVVAYHGARTGPAITIQDAINDGHFKILDPLPPATLKSIVNEAGTTDDLPPKFLTFLPSEDHNGCQE